MLATFSLALALGGLVSTLAVTMPMLEAPTGLVDANLARAIRAPLELRMATVQTAVVGLAAASLLGRDEGKAPATCALLALICLLVHRLWLLPETHEALTRVDLVALRPAAKLDLALAWQSRGMRAQWAATTLIALAIALRESLALKSLRAVARSVTTRGDADTGG